MAAVAPSLVVTGVDRHPIEPGAEGALSGEAIRFAEYRYEGLLGGIESRFTVAQHPQADRENPVFVSPHQLVEGGDVSAQVALDESSIGNGAVGHGGNANGQASR